MFSNQNVTANPAHVATPELSETALLWARGGNRAVIAHLIATAPHVCPACETPCGALIQGVCLGCLIEWDEQIAAAEARYDAAAETCCSCGID